MKYHIKINELEKGEFTIEEILSNGYDKNSFYKIGELEWRPIEKLLGRLGINEPSNLVKEYIPPKKLTPAEQILLEIIEMQISQNHRAFVGSMFKLLNIAPLIIFLPMFLQKIIASNNTGEATDIHYAAGFSDYFASVLVIVAWGGFAISGWRRRVKKYSEFKKKLI